MSDYMILLQDKGSGRDAYLTLNDACRLTITDLELTALDEVFDNSTIEKDVPVSTLIQLQCSVDT